MGASCGRAEPAPAPAPAPAPTPSSPLLASRQLVVGIVAGWDSTAVSLRLWERDSGDAWRARGASWPGTVGRAGVGWGAGLHGDGAPAGRGGPVKREGDHRSPAGAFAITAAFGYPASPPAGATLRYAAVDDAWRCVDDPASAHYNRVFAARGVTVDWQSAEDMRREDDLYRWVIEIGHNGAGPLDAAQADAVRPVPGRGSCIFFHVWADADSPTVGCTAMAPAAIEALLAVLDPARSPVYVLLPAAAYDALATPWVLPRR